VSVTWQQAALVAGLVAIAALTARLAIRRVWIVADVLTECAVLFALYAVWQLVLVHTVTTTTGAVSHGRWVWRVERTFHLPSERALQSDILPHQWLVTFFNRWYLISHYTGLLVCLTWAFVFHRDKYRWTRRMLILATALLTVPFQSIPVAPPRLLPELGLVDTAHSKLATGLLDGLRDPGQLTAMPSVHVAWAVLVAVVVVSLSTSPWRWLAVIYPVLTMTAVVVTGNHFWADGIVGAAIVAIAVLADRFVRHMRFAHSGRQPLPHTTNGQEREAQVSQGSSAPLRW
jgi:hypothetical protein